MRTHNSMRTHGRGGAESFFFLYGYLFDENAHRLELSVDCAFQCLADEAPHFGGGVVYNTDELLQYVEPIGRAHA